jgi:mono/diheme cytochrome c family protein
MNRQFATTIIGGATAIGLGLVLSFGAAAFDAATLADYSGEEIFNTFCASCHGESGRGDGPVAANLVNVVPNLTTIAQRYGEFPAGRIRETIDGRGVVVSAHGTRAMPVWGYEFWVEEGADVNAQREVRVAIDKLVDYVRSLQVEAGQRTDPR